MGRGSHAGMGVGRAVALIGVAVVCALALYAGALGHPFVGDDRLAVSGNPTVAQPSVAGLRALWVHDYWQGVDPYGRVTELSTDRNLYRPVTMLSFWLNSWLAGVDPTAFRAANVTLHALAAGLIGILCAGLGWRRGAFVAAAFVLVHPVATDVVNRIVGRADVLAVVGVTACLIVQRGALHDGWTWGRALVGFLAACVALGAKESGVVLVPLALLQDWLGRGGASASMEHGPTRTHAVASEEHASIGYEHATAPRGWLGVVAVVAAVALYLTGRGVAVDVPAYAAVPTWDLGGNPLWGAGLGTRLPVACMLAWHYARFMMWPAPLLAFDVPPVMPTWGDATSWIGLAVLVLVGAGFLLLAWRRRATSLAALWWLASFLVVGQLLIAIGAYREVRFAYAMVAGAALALGWLAELVLERGVALRALGAIALLVWVSLAVVAVCQRNADFRDLRTLLEADVRQLPASPAALIRLANIHDREGRHDEAERTFVRVMELAPASAQARYEMADFYARRGRADLARSFHERAVALNPSHYLSLLALGAIALDERDLARAAGLFTRAAAIAPDDPFVIYNLAVLDDARGERDRARARLTALVERRPDFTLAVRGLEKLRAAEARKH